MNKKWIISLDADGTTLLTKDKWNIVDGVKIPTTHEINKKVIKELQEQGHYIVLNTGRGWFGAKKVFEEIGFNTFAITSAGSLITLPSEDNRIIFNEPIPKNIALEIANEQLVIDNYQQIYFDGHEYCHTYVNKETPLIESISINRRVTIKDNLNLDFNPENMIISLDVTLEESQKIISMLNDKYGNYIIATNYQGNREGVVAIELNSAKSDKGDAVLKLADYLGIPRENTIAMGDGENDIDMLKKVKYGVALKNALPIAKESADIILDWDNNDGAVGLFLKEFIK